MVLKNLFIKSTYIDIAIVKNYMGEYLYDIQKHSYLSHSLLW